MVGEKCASAEPDMPQRQAATRTARASGPGWDAAVHGLFMPLQKSDQEIF